MNTFSRRVNEQYRWQQALLGRLLDNLEAAHRFKMKQDEYLARREAILSTERRLTHTTAAYVHGYLKGREDALFRTLIYVRRFIGRPGSATAAGWDELTEEMREALRTSAHTTESCLAWDNEGVYNYGDWRTE